MVSILIPLYGQLLQVIGYIETRTDIKQDGILEPEVGASRVSMSLDDFADAM